jgi:hypothetical protein
MFGDDKHTSINGNERSYSSGRGNNFFLKNNFNLILDNKGQDFRKCENMGDINQCKATRLCTRCKMYICAECCFDSHFDHVSETCKIEDFMSKIKDEASNFLLKIDLRLNNSKFIKTGIESGGKYKKMIEDTINADEKILQNIRAKIDGMMETLQKTKKQYYSLIDQNMEKFSSNPTYKKILKGKKKSFLFFYF